MKWAFLVLLLLLAWQRVSSEDDGSEDDSEDDQQNSPTPIVDSIVIYNTVNQQEVGHVAGGQKLDICSLKNSGINAPSQLAFRAWTTDTKSVDFTFNSVFYRRENFEPFTLCGDNGEGSYTGCTDLKYGYQCISAKPYNLGSGQGVAGSTLKVCFDVVGCPAPVKPPFRAPVPVPVPALAPVRLPIPVPAPAPIKLPVPVPVAAPLPVPVLVPVMPPTSVTRFELINTVKQNTIRTLTNGETIDICKLGSVGIQSPSQLNFRAVTSGNVESVQFNKNSNFFRNDNMAFFSLCGDNGGFPYLGCTDLTLGYQCISAKACTQDNAEGVCGVITSICFTIIGCPAPTRDPIKSPTTVPIRKPTNAPTRTPAKAPTKNPERLPTRASNVPIKSPTAIPVRAPILATTKAPTNKPINAPTTIPVRAPTSSPIKAPTLTPNRVPSNTPISPPVSPPVRAPVTVPVSSPTVPTSDCSVSPLGLASLYSLFIFTSVSGLQNNRGNVAIGGNANLKNPNVQIAGNLIVNGNLFTTSGQVVGKVTIGGKNNMDSSFLAFGGITGGRPIDIPKEKLRLQLLSQKYATYVVTGNTSYSENDEIILTCDTLGLSVFTVNGIKLSTTKALQVIVPLGVTVLINVIGTSYISLGNYVTTLVNTTPNKVLWNMPSVNNLQISNINIQGSVLAPNAVINYSNGSFNGTIIGNSWTGNGLGLSSLFNGCIPQFD